MWLFREKLLVKRGEAEKEAGQGCRRPGKVLEGLNEQHNSQLENRWILISAQEKRTAWRCFGEK
jgi:hypothetical protein